MSNQNTADQAIIRHRKGAGADTGNAGHFANVERRRSSVALQERPESVDEEIFEMADRYTSYAFVRQARGQARDYSFEQEDARQDVLLRMLNDKARGKGIEGVRDLAGYVSRVSNNVVYKNVDERYNPVNFKAIRLHKEIIALEEQVYGEKMSTAHRNWLGEMLRDNWEDPNHRPTWDYRNSNVVHGTQRLDMPMSGDTDQTMGTLLATPNHAGSSVPVPGTFMERAMDRADEGGAKAMAAARRLAYNASAELGGHPQASHAFLSRRQVTAASKAVRGYDGGVHGIVDAYEDGSLDPEVEKAFFAPFPDADRSGRESICQMLGSKDEDMSMKLWLSAVTYSSVDYKQN